MDNHPSLLSKEQCLVLSPTLAVMIGDRQAILLQQIQYWLDINEKTKSNYRDGRWWTYNTYEAWIEESFPFWNIRMLRRLMKDLEERGLVIARKFESADWKQRKWYTIDYDAVAALETPESTEKSDVANLATSSWPPEAHHLYTETTTETTNPRTASSSKSASYPYGFFNGGESQKLKIDPDGWVKLPKPNECVPGLKELMGQVIASAMTSTKQSLVDAYCNDLDLEVENDFTEQPYSVTGKDFTNERWETFLGPDGSMPVKMMFSILKRREVPQLYLNQILIKAFYDSLKSVWDIKNSRPL